MSNDDRNRKRLESTLAADVHAYLKQPHINASGLIEAAIRDKVDDAHIKQAARQAGMSDEEIEEARQR